MTLKEIKNHITKLQNNLNFYMKKKQINFEKTQPTSIKLKDLVVDEGFKNWDPFMSYMIKDEECDKEIYSIQKELLAYQELLVDEIIRMKKSDDIPLIVFLKEEEKMSWKQIDKYLNYGYDYSRTKYKRFKNLK